MARLPKYRRHSSGRAFVEWKGRRHYLPGEYDSRESRAAYKAFLRTCALAAEPPAVVRVGEMTIAEIGMMFLRWAADRYGTANSSSPYHHFRRALVDLVDAYGDLGISELGPVRLAVLRDGWIAKGWSRTHINSQVQRVRQVVRWAVARELCRPAVLEGLRALPGLRHGQGRPAKRVRPADWDSQVWPTCQHVSPVIRAMILLQWHTGARSENVCELRPRELERSGNVWAWRPAEHKTASRGHDLVIWLGPQAQQAITPYLDRPADAYCFTPSESCSWHSAARAAQALAPGQRPRSRSRILRDHYTPRTYRQAVNYGIKKAGVPSWTPHQLRHARASVVRRKYGLEAAQAALGHASLDATQIYAERLLELARRAARETG